MVYVPQPYVTGNNNNNNSNNNYQQQQQQQTNSSNRQPQNTYATTGATSHPSSAYAPAPAGGYSTTTNYSTAAYAPTSTGGYSTTNQTAQPATTSAPSTSRAGGFSTATNYASKIATKYGMPDFSQALNLPPPTAAATPAPTTYGSSSTMGGQTPAYAPNHLTAPQPSAPTAPTAYGSAIAIPVNNTGGYYDSGNTKISGAFSAGALNSSTYTGGPTGGLISEGNPTICQKVDYEIKGHEMQLVEIELDPSECVIAEAGALMYLEDGIDFKTKFGDGSTPKEGFFKKLLSAGGRLLMGESLFITHFTNQGNTKARVAFAAPFPGSILPINLQNLGGKIICEKDAFLCAAKGTKLSIHLNKKFGSGLFGGEGFILQKVEGDGMAFIHAGGMVIKRELRGEKLRIDTGCVVAFTEGINFDIQFVPGLKSMFFGGEGLFLATLQGTGTVWLQSLPFSRFADRVIQFAPSAGGRRQGEGSALTGRFGDVVNGGGIGFKF